MHNLMDLHIRFSERGFGPLPTLVERMDKVHVVVQKMSVKKEDQDINSIRLVLELPKSLTPAGPEVTGCRLVHNVHNVQDAHLPGSTGPSGPTATFVKERPRYLHKVVDVTYFAGTLTRRFRPE